MNPSLGIHLCLGYLTCHSTQVMLEPGEQILPKPILIAAHPFCDRNEASGVLQE